MSKSKLFLYSLTHPDSINGWVFLTENAAKKAIKKLIKAASPKQPNFDYDKFIITMLSVQDQEIIKSFKETRPELFL